MIKGTFVSLILVVGLGLAFTLSSCNSGQRRVQTIVPAQSPCAGGKCGPGGCCSSGGDGRCCPPQGGWAGGCNYSVGDGSQPTDPHADGKSIGPAVIAPDPGDRP